MITMYYALKYLKKINMIPKITLITCTYYRPDLLRRAILSVQKQTLQEYEHIIISDHCPFAAMVYDEFSYDSRIRFMEVTDPYVYNLGAIPFNLGIKNAKSNIICYLLDDDIIYDNHLEQHYTFYKENPNETCYQTRYDHSKIHEPNNTVEFICSNSLSDLKKYNSINVPWDDVGAISHIKNINAKWTPQSELAGSWEDSVFMNQIGINGHCGDVSSMKVQWGGLTRKNTKGLDHEYYNLLMSKLVEDKHTNSGYRVIDSSPYVYNNLKDSLYG